MENFFVNKPRLHFITVKGSTERQHKIGYMHDLLRKVSDTYYIVREPNIIADGYHFHALVSINKDYIEKKWYRKGVHIHVEALCKGKANIPQSFEEELYRKYGGVDEDDPFGDNMTFLQKQILDIRHAACQKIRILENRDKKKTDVGRVLSYMSKTHPTERYVDYMFVVDSLSVPRSGDPDRSDPPAVP